MLNLQIRHNCYCGLGCPTTLTSTEPTNGRAPIWLTEIGNQVPIRIKIPLPYDYFMVWNKVRNQSPCICIYKSIYNLYNYLTYNYGQLFFNKSVYVSWVTYNGIRKIDVRYSCAIVFYYTETMVQNHLKAYCKSFVLCTIELA